MTLALFSFASCTLNSPVKAGRLRISIPSQSAHRSSRAQSQAMSTPTDLSSFNCYGVKVTGPGIMDDPRMGCGPGGGIGILGGLVPSTGGDIEVLVPSGPARNVVVFGLQSSEGCAAFDQILQRPPGTRFANLGSFYNVGAAMVDVMDDTSVTIKVSYSATSEKLLSGCPGFPVSGTATTAGSVFSGGVLGASGGAGANHVSAKFIIGSPFFFNTSGSALGGTGAAFVKFQDGVDHE